MERTPLERLLALTGAPDALERTLEYLEECIGQFLRRQERVLLCFKNRAPGSTGALLEEAIRRLGGQPVFWGPDFRWKSLLRQTFSSRATVIAGPPPVILGLTKVARATATPLYVRNVLLAGTPCTGWMLEGIQKGLDSRLWGCFDPGGSTVVAGFSCQNSLGIHVRESEYDVRIVDSSGIPVLPGVRGEITLTPRADPSLSWRTGYLGRFAQESCGCGAETARIVDLTTAPGTDRVLTILEELLLSWTSVLDYRARQTECGLELEVITFPGLKVPKFPSCAKCTVRNWNSEQDAPFSFAPGWH